MMPYDAWSVATFPDFEYLYLYLYFLHWFSFLWTTLAHCHWLMLIDADWFWSMLIDVDDNVTPSSNTRSYTCRSVPTSLGRSFLNLLYFARFASEKLDSCVGPIMRRWFVTSCRCTLYVSQLDRWQEHDTALGGIRCHGNGLYCAANKTPPFILWKLSRNFSELLGKTDTNW